MKAIITYTKTFFHTSIGLVLLLLLLCCSCVSHGPVGKLEITESAGIARDLEYVEVEISLNKLPLYNQALFLKDNKNGALKKIQILHSQKKTVDGYAVQCLFPIRINAMETRQYHIVIAKNTKVATDLKVKGDGMEILIENNQYVADVTSEMATVENELMPGQLTELTLKKFDKRKLRRSKINMHWAPNFQKEGLDYKTIGHIRQYDSIFVGKGPYLITLYRSGKVEGYEEIQVEGKYEFYAGVPYFLFSSQMTMIDNVVLTMLRNDEMTLDSLFTHAMFPLANGKIKTISLYDAPPLNFNHSIKELRKNPVDVNAKWFCFINDSLKYGFGSVRIQYDNTNLKGGISPMLDPETRITYSGGNGRYWDRRFVFVKKNENGMKIPEGSRYAEKNAYVIFTANPENPTKEIEELFTRLTKPVLVKYYNY